MCFFKLFNFYTPPTPPPPPFTADEEFDELCFDIGIELDEVVWPQERVACSSSLAVVLCLRLISLVLDPCMRAHTHAHTRTRTHTHTHTHTRTHMHTHTHTVLLSSFLFLTSSVDLREADGGPRTGARQGTGCIRVNHLQNRGPS